MKKFCFAAILLISFNALAESTPTIVASSETTGRKCGDNCTWTLDSSGTLIVSGKGPMYNYSHPGFNSSETSWSPWFGMTESVTNVVVENGITEIGQWAFKNVNASNISIPPSVTRAGYGFAETSAVKNLVIPDTVTTLGGAFCHNCKDLETVYISKNVTKMEGHSFQDLSPKSGVVVVPPNATFSGYMGGIERVTTYCTAAQMPTCGANSVEYEQKGDLFIIRDENGEMKEVFGGYDNFNANVMRASAQRDTFSVDEDGSIIVKSASGDYSAKYSITGQLQRKYVYGTDGSVAEYDGNGSMINGTIHYQNGSFATVKNGQIIGMTKRGPFTIPEANALTKDGPVNTVIITW